MRSAEMRERMIVSLYLLNQRGGASAFYSDVVARNAGLGASQGMITLLVEAMEEDSLLRRLTETQYVGGVPVGDRPTNLVQISWKGIEAAEELLERQPALGLDLSVPAADRYVALSDNQSAAIGGDLGKLKDAVQGANDVVEEDRLIALSEIAAFEQTIIQPRLSTELVERFANTVLRWIIATFATAVVGQVAQGLIQALLKLIA